MQADHPIGVFDSGVGGLTVVRALTAQLPHEKIIYLGDTARVPYGSKSGETVIRYSEMAERFLRSHQVKLLVVACNTVSAFALERLAALSPVPVLGVIEPGARAAVAATRSRHVGVIGTLGTVRSESYLRALHAADATVRVTALACPLFVPLAEEGWLDGEVPTLTARRYLGELARCAPDLDVLVLGCTHYPLLRPVLERVVAELFDKPVTLIDSAESMARAARTELTRRALLRDSGTGRLSCYVTDAARIDEVGQRFLGRPLDEVTRVDL